MTTLAQFHIDHHSLEFDLPTSLIAQEALPKRDEARLMVLSRNNNEINHKQFFHLKNILNENDVLVINTTRVRPSKLIGKKETGGRVEIILINPFDSPVRWKALIRPQLKPGTKVHLESNTVAVLDEQNKIGENILRFIEGDAFKLMETKGVLPIPPYIKRDSMDDRSQKDSEDYQTVYAAQLGSLAAPTAGLHFTQELLAELKNKGVQIVELLLHVGWGTFKPVVESVDKHQMLPEPYFISKESISTLKKARQEKKRIIAVGTTSTRVLESLPDHLNEQEISGETNIFIKPGFSFRWVSGLITNFHVPRSTPLSLTAAFVGWEKLEQAYETAIKENYRFFSYGDAMLIL